MFDCAEKKLEDLSRLVLRGALDGSTAGGFEKSLDSILAAGGTRVAVDCSALTFISSAGLRVFLSFAKKVRKAGGGLALYGLAPLVKNVFVTAGFDSFLPIFEREDEAVARVKPPSAS